MAKRRDTLAAVIVGRAGWLALKHSTDLLVLWCVATKSGAEPLTIPEVREYGERTHWGSQAKFYRYLEDWRKGTGLDHPGVYLERVRVNDDRATVTAQFLSVPAASVGGA